MTQVAVDTWEWRVGQVESVLNWFGSVCSINVERADGSTVYIQAQRIDDDRLEVEAVGPRYIAESDTARRELASSLVRLGWSSDPLDLEGNHARVGDTSELHQLAVDIVATMQSAYGVSLDDRWSVYPPQFADAEVPPSDDAPVIEYDEITVVNEATGEPEPFSPVGMDASEPARGGVGAITRFSPNVQEKIGWYVYLLRDPRDGQVFYVGKGVGDRVFSHAQAALVEADETDSLKLARIREIHHAGLRVDTELLRHRIPTEQQALLVESAVIDAYRAVGHDVTNRVRGHGALYGWASTSVVASIYEAPPLPETDVPIVFFKIARLWTPAMTQSELFEATRGWWPVGPRSAAARYAVAVSKGVTRGAYRISYWRERVEGDRDYEPGGRTRLGFWGEQTGDLDHLLNRSITHLPQPSGGGVVYYNIASDAAAIVPVYRGSTAAMRAAEESF